MEWFDVNERMPSPKRGYYLVCSVIKNDKLTSRIGICYYEESKGWDSWEKDLLFFYKDTSEVIDVKEITHWAPIPRDPTGKLIYSEFFIDHDISEKIIER